VSDEVAPSDAVDLEAVASAGEEVAPDHVDAEGAPVEESIGSPSTWKDMLLATDPSQSLEATESPWDPVRGGPTRIYRGMQKMAGFEGMPAIADVVIGTIETVVAFEPEGGGGDDVEETDADAESADVAEGARGLSAEQLEGAT